MIVAEVSLDPGRMLAPADQPQLQRGKQTNKETLGENKPINQLQQN